MEMPQEIEVWYVFPALRRELARALKEKGLSQSEIAKKLSITESAVSQYLNNKRGKGFIFPKKILSLINKTANNIIKGKNKNKNAIDELYILSSFIRKEKVLCRVHRKYSAVPKNCSICLK
ncbi:MAG: helix-turn-helix domain-containing protein [Candidatus Woesearchaeota archaeon]